ncbi:MAG: hypothetical protein JST06_07085 [Bacteroidetes bacterium]|nr:hypothetical protein [Bacteroidota bacterium]
MPTVKKLRLILSDTEQLMAQLEQRNRSVQLRFTCYRNNQPIHQGGPIKRSQLASVLPEACRQHSATELDLLITGTDHTLKPVELYKESFALATKEQSSNLPVPYQNNGLGSYGPLQVVQPQMYGGGLAGLGAPPEVVVWAQHIAADYRFQDEHRRLQEEVASLRQRVKEQESQIANYEDRLNSRNAILSIMHGAKAVAPIAASLIGPNTKVGQALAGVGNADLSQIESPDDPLTAQAIDMLRKFMVTLQSAHKSQLIMVMQHVQADHNLIARLASAVEQWKRSSHGGGAQHSAQNRSNGQVQSGQPQRPAQRPEQRPEQGQHAQQHQQQQETNQANG